MKVKQKDVPLNLRRITAEFLESMRDQDDDLNAQDLYLGDEVWAVYRPDLKDIAYYEFRIHKATRENPDSRKDLVPNVRKINRHGVRGFSPIYSTPNGTVDRILERFKDRRISSVQSDVQGFILVSTGVHDFPVPNFSLETLPPSLMLEQEAADAKKEISKIYKIDSLTFLAEDSEANAVAHVGEMPSLLEGLPSNLAENDQGISTTITKEHTSKTRPLDDSHELKETRSIVKGPEPSKIRFVTSEWPKLKKEFAKSLKPLLDDLRHNASKAWKIQKLIEENGEGFFPGDMFILSVPEKEFSFTLEGEATDYVRTRVVKRPGGFSAIEFASRKVELKKEMSLTVHLDYGNDLEEKVELFIVNPSTPSSFTIDEKEES